MWRTRKLVATIEMFGALDKGQHVKAVVVGVVVVHRVIGAYQEDYHPIVQQQAQVLLSCCAVGVVAGMMK